VSSYPHAGNDCTSGQVWINPNVLFICRVWLLDMNLTRGISRRLGSLASSPFPYVQSLVSQHGARNGKLPVDVGGYSHLVFVCLPTEQQPGHQQCRLLPLPQCIPPGRYSSACFCTAWHLYPGKAGLDPLLPSLRSRPAEFEQGVCTPSERWLTLSSRIVLGDTSISHPVFVLPSRLESNTE
jgi:hypothetical protein